MTEITSNAVHLSRPNGDSIIETETVLWGAGVQAKCAGRKLAASIGIENDRAGRLPVNNSCQVVGQDKIFAIGDIAASTDSAGKPLPGLASVALQQGRYVATAITCLVNGDSIDAVFKYRDYGTMATIGRSAAVAQIGKRQFCGAFAWFLWLFVHLMLIVQFQNRVLILMQWGWSYVTFNRSNRIITGERPVILIPKANEKANT